MDASKHFGKYEIIEELGKGGFGTVYHVRETVLDVERAIKVLHSNLLTDETFLARFKREARMSAQLEHPNIVPVYEFGQAEGLNYLAMKYMPNGSLKELLARQGRLSLEETLQLFEDICSGVAFAHQKGIIHRDLKPSNLLIDEFGHMRVSDFGFAKAMASSESASMSSTGSMIGTPAYMATEIWRGKPATVQSDIYSLGCILYEMLTGKVLFEGESPAEVITKHVIDGPQYNDELPQQIRLVLDKALQRDPEQRFVDIKALQESSLSGIKPYQEEQIIASSDGITKAKPEQDRQHAIIGAEHNLLKEDSSEIESSNKSNVEEQAINEDLSLQSQVDPAKKLEFHPKKSLYKKLTKSQITAGLVGVVIILGLIAILVWTSGSKENTQLPSVSVTSQPTVAVAAASTFDQFPTSIKTVEPSPTETVLPTQTMTALPIDLLGSTVLNSFNSGLVEQLARLGKGTVEEVAYSPDGSLIAIGSSIGVFLYNSDTLVEMSYFAEDISINCIAWSPDGQTLASGSNDNEVILWDVQSGEKLRTLAGHTSLVSSVAWSPDGQTLASGSWDNTVILWDAQSGEKLRTLAGHTSYVYSVDWSPDGHTLASGGYGTVILWDVQSGEKLHTLAGHTDYVRSVAWSPDGKTLASGSADNTVILWDAQSGEELRTLAGHTRSVNSVAWSPDGQTLASGSYDDTIILWDAQSGEKLRTLAGHTSSVNSVAWSPDGLTLASGGYDNEVILWDAQSGEKLRTLVGHTYWVYSVAWSPDGKTLASGSWDDTIILWDAHSGEKLRTLAGHTDWVRNVAWSPDGQTLASGADDNTVILWDAQSGEKLRTLAGHTSSVYSVAWSPDGKTLASGGGGTVILWDVQSGEKLRALAGHTYWVYSVAWSPDGKTLASGGGDGTVRLWGIS